jgi:hypothetical protein
MGEGVAQPLAVNDSECRDEIVFYGFIGFVDHFSPYCVAPRRGQFVRLGSQCLAAPPNLDSACAEMTT